MRRRKPKGRRAYVDAPPEEPVPRFPRDESYRKLHPMREWRVQCVGVADRMLRTNLALYDGLMERLMRGDCLLAYHQLDRAPMPTEEDLGGVVAYARIGLMYVRRRLVLAEMLRRGKHRVLGVDTFTAWGLSADQHPGLLIDDLDGRPVSLRGNVPRLDETGEFIASVCEVCIDRTAAKGALRVRCSGCLSYVPTCDANMQRCPRCLSHFFCSRACAQRHRDAHEPDCSLERERASDAVDELEQQPGFPFTRLLHKRQDGRHHHIIVPIELALELPEVPSLLWYGNKSGAHPAALENRMLVMRTLRDRVWEERPRADDTV